MKHAANTGADNGFDWRDTLIWCGVPVAIVLLVRMFLVGFYVIPSGSMMDTIEPGDRVITTKLTPKLFSLRRGDVVVFKDPDHWLQEENSGRLGGDFLIKRLIGLPGDTVACEGRASRSPSTAWPSMNPRTFAPARTRVRSLSR